MIEEVAPRLFRVNIPLPGSPLKYLNSYFILGEPRNLIVDTGLNRPECLEAMRQAIAELGVDLERTDFFITHLHADHFALTSKVASEKSRIFFNRPEAEIIEAGTGWGPMIEYGGLNGFPRDELEAALKNHPGYKYASEWVPHLSLINEGDLLSVGGYNFSCLLTPGHTLGHTCLWEADQGILVAGDHILGDITPNIQCWKYNYDPLASYLDSLEKVSHLPVRLTLPGHRSLVADCKLRIQELTEHHHQRLAEIISILATGSYNAYQTAARMRWDIKCDTWEEFPVAQKWFATGEAMAHLRYLENKQEIARGEREGVTVYGLPG